MQTSKILLILVLGLLCVLLSGKTLCTVRKPYRYNSHQLAAAVTVTQASPVSTSTPSLQLSKRGNVISYFFGGASNKKKTTTAADNDQSEVITDAVSASNTPSTIGSTAPSSTSAATTTAAAAVGVPVSRPRKKRYDDDDYYVPGGSFSPLSPFEDMKIRGSPGIYNY